uniref:Uncharacterized protein n=1 Tax=Chromera velia CCMP2878 TaxID=1169474 RepID=A0A0K6S7H9_9ALVE|eukprot:Cvel_21764.t1-p1 / transcript=Cvel_21764.t1 / gene=Cvel_21764 / organism=Chromera_velia_CCMP2878 / gene_product=IQ domain-containing protein D, putative / transcript_product=IQ domain-containing protein D, putative / location=Cvel_scaffold2069:28869-29918(-) / protein_length=178 / sequence_SO=supercontig / SO=protein_coding / is_pseudo=false
MSSVKLEPIEAFRAQTLLDEALKKLEFLTTISNTHNATRDDLTAFIGDEITRIIQEQRSLEAEYEDLVVERSRLKGLTNKAAYIEVQKKIKDVSYRLRQSNKTLCQNLKENPDPQKNLQKLEKERSNVQQWFEDLKKDLSEFHFQSLASKVIHEQQQLDLLKETKQKERSDRKGTKSN